VAKYDGLVSREALVNRLRQAGFTFKRQADRVEIYKQKGTTTRVTVRRRDLLDAEHVSTVLRQAGLTEAEIATFFQQINL